MVKFRGGFNIPLSGAPDREVITPQRPEALKLPLSSSRFSFDEVLVKDGDIVSCGQILARDTQKFNIPLLASIDGTIRICKDDGFVEITGKGEKASSDTEDEKAEKKKDLSVERLVENGVWSEFYLLGKSSETVPSPEAAPSVLLISPFRPGFFQVTGEALLKGRIDEFISGMKALKGLYSNVEMKVLLPEKKGASFVVELETSLKDSGAEILRFPDRYPFGELLTTARALHLTDSEKPVFGLYASGVLAISALAGKGEPNVSRVLSFAGPAVTKPAHYNVPVGFPVECLAKDNISVDGDVRFICGGALCGHEIEKTSGVGLETSGITVLEEHKQREFLSFMRPGFGKSAYVPAFIGNLLGTGKDGEALTTAVRGETRPCVSCGYCEEVCPVGIMPYYIHKLLYQDELEQAERAQIDRCTSCGICSYVCPSKIELSKQFMDGQETIARELHGEEEEA